MSIIPNLTYEYPKHFYYNDLKIVCKPIFKEQYKQFKDNSEPFITEKELEKRYYKKFIKLYNIAYNKTKNSDFNELVIDMKEKFNILCKKFFKLSLKQIYKEKVPEKLKVLEYLI